MACLDGKSGDVHWRERLEHVDAGFSGSPICVGDRLLCVAENGKVIVLDAAKEFKELGRSELGALSRSTPAVAHNRLYFRTYSQLVSVGGK